MTFANKALMLAAAALLPAAASALTVTYTGSYGPALTDYDQSFLLTGFNTTLGTLTGVKLDFTVTGTASGTVTNTSPTAKFFSISEMVAFGFAYPQSVYLNTLTSSQTYTLGGGATASFGPNNISDTQTFNAFDFTPYKVPSFSVGLNTLSGVTILGGGGNITTAITTSLGFGTTVTYTYDAPAAIPEPASWALMVAGFGIVGSSLRRRPRALAA